MLIVFSFGKKDPANRRTLKGKFLLKNREIVKQKHCVCNSITAKC